MLLVSLKKAWTRYIGGAFMVSINQLARLCPHAEFHSLASVSLSFLSLSLAAKGQWSCWSLAVIWLEWDQRDPPWKTAEQEAQFACDFLPWEHLKPSIGEGRILKKWFSLFVVFIFISFIPKWFMSIRSLESVILKGMRVFSLVLLSLLFKFTAA